MSHAVELTNRYASGADRSRTAGRPLRMATRALAAGAIGLGTVVMSAGTGYADEADPSGSASDVRGDTGELDTATVEVDDESGGTEQAGRAAGLSSSDGADDPGSRTLGDPEPSGADPRDVVEGRPALDVADVARPDDPAGGAPDGSSVSIDGDGPAADLSEPVSGGGDHPEPNPAAQSGALSTPVGGGAPFDPVPEFLQRIGVAPGPEGQQTGSAGGGSGPGGGGSTDRPEDGESAGFPFVYQFDDPEGQPDFRRVSRGEEMRAAPTVYVDQDPLTKQPIYAFGADPEFVGERIGMNTAWIDPDFGSLPDNVTRRRGGWLRTNVDAPRFGSDFVVPVPVGERTEPMRVGIEIPYTSVGHRNYPAWVERPIGGGSFLNCSVAGCDFAFAQDGSLSVAQPQPDGSVRREWRGTTTPPDVSQAAPGYGKWVLDEGDGTATYHPNEMFTEASPTRTHLSVSRSRRGDIEKVELEGGAAPGSALGGFADPDGVPGASYRMVASPTDPYENFAEGNVDGVDFAFGPVSSTRPEDWRDSITLESILDGSYVTPELFVNGVIDGDENQEMTPDQLTEWLESLGLPMTVNPYNVAFDPDSSATASLSRLFDHHVTLQPDNSLQVMNENGTVYVFPATQAPAESADGTDDRFPPSGTSHGYLTGRRR